MATSAVTYSFVANTAAKASEVNRDFADLVSFLNTSVVQKDGSIAMSGLLTLSGAPSSALHAATKAYVDTASGNAAWTAYTPTLIQSGAITKTVNSARYTTIGKLCIAEVTMTTTANGTSGNPILAGMPLTSAALAANQVLGSFYYWDNTASVFVGGDARFSTTTTIDFTYNNVVQPLGNLFQSRTGSQLSFQVAYELP
jgi:hypothetical protein